MRQVISIKEFFCPVNDRNCQNLWRQKRQGSYHPIHGRIDVQLHVSALNLRDAEELPPDYAWNFAG